MVSLLLLALMSAPGRASDSLAYPTQGYRLWSWTAVEGLPSRLGETELRAAEQLAVELAPGRRTTIYGIGAVAKSAEGDGPDTVELYRLHATWRQPSLVLDAGRLSRWDVRGRHHLDGINAVIGSGKLTADAWAGQLWHPETWQVGHTLVGGGELGWRPRPGVHALGGAEVRGDLDGAEAVGLRLHAATSAWGARGQRALALIEGQPAEGVRATLDGTLPVAQRLELELGGRWEGLEPATLPVALDSPQAWLGAEGYGVVTAGARLKAGMVFAQATGGPTFHPQSADELGGSARVEVGAQTEQGLRIGVAGVGAAIGDGWVAGGTLGGGLEHDGLDLRAEGGLFRYMALAGGLGEVAEGRLRAEVPLLDRGNLRSTRRLVLATELAAGTDRILSRWMRGGLALHGTLAGPRTHGDGT